MGSQLRMFTYSDATGYQMTDTSMEAAKSIDKSGKAKTHQRILEALRYKDMTADELAAFLGESVLYMRPRLTELKRLRLIRDTGNRRKNESGKSAAVMGLCTKYTDR